MYLLGKFMFMRIRNIFMIDNNLLPFRTNDGIISLLPPLIDLNKIEEMGNWNLHDSIVLPLLTSVPS